MVLKLPFGLKDGKLVEIAEVESGLDCGCFCPACGHPLVARKGNSNIHHFAHHKAPECVGGLETSLHIAAKEILNRHKRIWIPAVITNIGPAVYNPIKLHKEQQLIFESVYLEKRIDDIVPDIIIEINGRQLLIEIAVTHHIDEIKLEKIKKLNISVIEIDLSKLDRQITLEDLEIYLLYDSDIKNWIYNLKIEAFNNEMKKYGKELKVFIKGIKHQIYACPLPDTFKKPDSYANLVYDCFNCEFLLDRRVNETNSLTHIICLGHAEKEINEVRSKFSVN